MGKRILSVSPRWLVDFLKERGGCERTYSITRNALPDDAKVVGFELPGVVNDQLELILESDEWWGDSREVLGPPEITVHESGDITINEARRSEGWPPIVSTSNAELGGANQ